MRQETKISIGNDGTPERRYASQQLASFVCEAADRQAVQQAVAGVLPLFRRCGVISVLVDHRSTQSCMPWEGLNQGFVIWGVARGDFSVLWDLTHEAGHATQGPPRSRLNEESLQREVDAWDWAWRYIEREVPHLAQFKESFDSHRAQCLESYRAHVP